MKAWYSKVRDTELKDGSVRATYVVTFETDNAELKREVEKYLQGIMDKTENSSEKPNNSLDKDINVRSKTEPQRNMAEDIVESFGFKAESYRQAKAKDEPQIDDFFREPTAEERKAVAEYIDSISVPTGVNIFDMMDEPQTERSE